MPDSGSGTGTPIGGGSPVGLLQPRPLPHTLLSLERYARIMGLNPAHFNQSYSIDVFPLNRACSDVWYKYPWQKADVISREDLAYAIHEAENQIANVLGYWPAPTWVSRDTTKLPKFHRPEFNTSSGRNVAGRVKSVQASYAKVLAAGRRAVALAADDVSVAYSDEDGDGFNETATVTVDISGSAAETILDNNWDESYASSKGLKVYFDGNAGAQEWEVRSPISHSYSGTTLTVVYRSWQLIRPELLEEFPQSNEDPQPIDLSVAANFVDVVDVYLEYTDRGSTSARMVWEETITCTTCSGSGCAVCNPYYDDGCATIRDKENGILVPRPADYSSDSWSSTVPTARGEPNYIELWYRSGAVAPEYEQGVSIDPLSHHFAQAITWLATARLISNICACGNSKAIADDLRKDLSVSSPEGNFVVAADEVLNNPFGTRKGEVLAWRTIRRLTPKSLTGVAL